MELGVQCLYRCSLTPEEYVARCGHRLVVVRRRCPRCGWRGRLRRHGSYERGLSTDTGHLIRISVARFLCLGCLRTISFLPAFAFSYRLIQVATFEAYLDGCFGRRDVKRWEELLRRYRRRMHAYGSELVRAIRGKLGRAPPQADRLWPYLRDAFGGLGAVTYRLVTQFKTTVFGRYRCHQTILLA
jgi:hypothetical protein